MNRRLILGLGALFATLFAAVSVALIAAETGKQIYKLQPVPLADVNITDEFWAPRIEVNRKVSIHHLFEKFGDRSYDNPRLIEAASYMVAKSEDPELRKTLEKLVDQEIASSETRLKNPIRISGYFYEAAVAYYHATGNRRMLEAAVKAFDTLEANYGPGKKDYISPHEGMKIGLLAMYRETGDPRYARLAEFFLDERGKDNYPRTGEYAIDRTYAQDDKPVVQQHEAEGHAVRATYLYIPFTDIASLTGGPAYNRAIDDIWQDAVFHKTYVTGSIGSIRFHEQYGQPYDLPNLSGWSETCASYGNFVWNQRMFLLHRDARFADLMERVLYNGFLDGVSLKGDRFFYQNPLMSYGNYERFDWIDTPCCPPNVVRLIASLGNYIYAHDDDDLYVNLFIGSKAHVNIGGDRVRIEQQTRYPWEGDIRISVDPDQPRDFSVYVRIPGWTGDQVMAGDLYSFLGANRSWTMLKVNGRAVNPRMANGYARINRKWKSGDSIELSLPMPVRRILANQRVKDDAGRVALERGPLVYCAEWPDNGGHALNLVVPDDAQFHTEFRRDLLNGVQVITAKVPAVEREKDGRVSTKAHELVAIPYYAWANRGMGEMAVWLPRIAEKAVALPVSLPPNVAQVLSSGGIEKKWTGYNDQNDDISAVYDGVDPLSSADESHRYFRMRPPVGEHAWVEYDFRQAKKISSSSVYFVDDKRFCKLPVSWRISYKEGDEWKPLPSSNTVEKDKFNSMTFPAVTTTAVRLEVEPQTRHYKIGEIGPPGAMFLDHDIDWREFGIIEWRVQ
ncbi:MAG TPA: beta-L-arabinofuranosidase domain-containing protein [Bryobacteraceae bacterium]|nr:beta-L-arabinofuranosidase domain-containing protein [Bryobacteraceae bacterium]